jgi:hypothetical protein
MAVPSSVLPLLFGACAVSGLGTACSLDEEGAVGFDAGRPDHGGSDARRDTSGLRETGHDVSLDVVADTSDVAPPVDAMPDVCSSTTTMSDPKNCGTCGHDCLGGACVAGQCQPKVIATTKMPQAIAVHTNKSGVGTMLYWTDVDPTDTPRQDVYSCSLPDCITATPSGSMTGCNMSLGVAVDATNYYFTCWTNSWFFACSSPASCASASPISTTTAMGAGVNNPSGILVDRGGTVPGIFLLAQTNGGGMHTGAVVYEPLGDGGAPTSFQGGQNYPSGIAKVGAELFWTETAGNVVSRCALSGSPPNCAGSYSQILPGAHLTPLPNPDQLAADATRLYFTSNGTMPMMFTDGVVFAASHDGTTLAPLAMGQSYPRGIAIDADYVYWVDYVGAMSTAGTVNRTPVGGGTVVTLASGLAAPVGITQDAAAIYWTNQGDGTVSRLAK